MKKRTVILTVLLGTILTAGTVFASESDTEAANQEENILQEMATANTGEALLANHDRVLYQILQLDSQGDTMYDYSIYFDGESYVSDFGTQITVDNQGDVYSYDKTEKAGSHYLFVGDAYDGYKQEMEGSDFYEYDEKETVVSQEEKDGVLILETEIDSADATEQLEACGFSIEEVEKVSECYEVNPETKEILSLEAYAVNGEEKQLINKITIDTECQQFEPEQEWLDAVFGDDFRTLTLITDNGTDQEKTYTQTVTKGQHFLVYPSEQYDSTLYADPEYKTEIQSPDLEKDITVYVKKTEE